MAGFSSVLRTSVVFLPFSKIDLSLRGISLRSHVSVGKGLPPSVEQVSLTLSPDFCSARKSPWI